MQAFQRWLGVKDNLEARKKVVTIDLFQHILIPTSGGPLADDRLNVGNDAQEALDNLAKCAARVAVKLAAICRVDLYTFGTFPRMYAKRVALPVGEQPETLLPNSSQVTEVEVREHVSVRVNMHFLFHPHYIVAHARHAEVAMRGRVALVAVVLARLGALVHGGFPFHNMFETLSKEIILSVSHRYFTTRRRGGGGGSGGGRRYTGGSARPINPLALEALRSEKFPHSVDGGSSGERSVRPPTGGAAGSSATPSSSNAVPVAPPPPPDDWYGEDLLDFLMIHEKMEEDLEEGRVEEEVEEEEEEEEEEEDGGPPPQLAEMSQEDDVEEEEDSEDDLTLETLKRKRAHEESPPAEAASQKKRKSKNERMNEEKKYSLIKSLRPRVDKLRADKSKVQPNGKLNLGVLINLFASLKDEIGSDFGDLDSFQAFVGVYIPSAHATFKGVPRDDVISMAQEYAHFDSGGMLTPPSVANLLKHMQEEHEDFSEGGGGGELKHFLSIFCFLEMYDMKKYQREVNRIFYATTQGKDFSVHEPSAKAALEEEEKKRDKSELTREGKKRRLLNGAYARIRDASKANGRCDGFPDVGAVSNWISIMQKKTKTADNAGGAGASGAGASGAGAGAGGSN
ncbi:hypothetical protein RI054_02g11700 [Pseudoscourfieldia marina]